jgi:hypothetical protein
MLTIMLYFHWQSFPAKMVMAERNNYAMPTCFGFLGRCDRNKNAHIYIVSHKVAKMSTVLDNITMISQKNHFA